MNRIAPFPASLLIASLLAVAAPVDAQQPRAPMCTEVKGWAPQLAPEDTLGYAHGDIVMAPARGYQYVLPADEGGISAPEETVQVLSIEFLGVMGHEVGGTLAPYRDPETGEMLHTTFEGRIEGNKIGGTLTTVHTRSMQVDVGNWEVFRKKT